VQTYPLSRWKMRTYLEVRAPGPPYLIGHPTKTYSHARQTSINQLFNTIEATRRSSRAAKPKRHFDSSPYPPSKPRDTVPKPSNRTLPKPQIALQPVVTEDSSTPHSSTTPQPFPTFVKLPIQKHNAKVLLAALEPFEIFTLFFPPKLLYQMITATNSYALRNHHNTKNP
jgi:hypothetical protein